MQQAAVMLIIKDGLILGVSRKDNPTKFGLPGGKVEPGEIPIQAAIREVFEEVGIKVKACQPIYKRTVDAKSQDGEDFEASCYYATIWEGEAVSKEGTTVAWLTENELTKTKAAFPEYNTNTLAAFKKLHPYVLSGHVESPLACKRCHEVHSSVQPCADNYPAGRFHRESEAKVKEAE